MDQITIIPEVKSLFIPTEYQRRFKEGRLAAGASLQSVAEAVGISLQAIGQFELGKQSMKIENFLKACEHLQLRTDWVLHGTGARFTGARPKPTKRGGRRTGAKVLSLGQRADVAAHVAQQGLLVAAQPQALQGRDSYHIGWEEDRWVG